MALIKDKDKSECDDNTREYARSKQMEGQMDVPAAFDSMEFLPLKSGDGPICRRLSGGFPLPLPLPRPLMTKGNPRTPTSIAGCNMFLVGVAALNKIYFWSFRRIKASWR